MKPDPKKLFYANCKTPILQKLDIVVPVYPLVIIGQNRIPGLFRKIANILILNVIFRSPR